MRNNKKPPYYLDGFLSIYRPKEENKTSFGAKKNVTSLEDMTHVIDLAYSQSYKRIQDIEYAESVGKDLSLKVKTRLVSIVQNDDKVVINNTLYDIVLLDEDRIKQELYIYLEEMYPIE